MRTTEQILKRLQDEAIRPKGYSQSHARKLFKERVSQHYRRALIYGSSSMRMPHNTRGDRG